MGWLDRAQQDRTLDKQARRLAAWIDRYGDICGSTPYVEIDPRAVAERLELPGNVPAYALNRPEAA
jgi:hypothetical protein